VVKLIIYLLKVPEKNVCPVCGEELKKGNIGYLEVNQDKTGFYITRVCKNCIANLHHLDGIFKRKKRLRHENITNKKTKKR